METPALETLALDDTLLVAFADRELDPLTTRLVAERVDANPVLGERVARLRRTAALLRLAMSTPDQLAVPPELAARVGRLAAPFPTTSWGRASWRRLGGVRWMPLAAAAALAGFVVGGRDIMAYLPFTGRDDTVVAQALREVADYHGIYAPEREHLVEVPASRKAHLEAWLGDRLKLPFQAPDLRAYELEFQGGRLLGTGRLPVAQLMYTGKDGVPVALCIALTEGDLPPGLQRHDDGDTTLYGQGVGRHVFVVAGPRGNPSLRALADAMPGLLKRS